MVPTKFASLFPTSSLREQDALPSMAEATASLPLENVSVPVDGYVPMPSADADNVTWTKLTPQDKAVAARLLLELDQRARLFVADDHGTLRRTSPGEVKQALDKHSNAQVYVVTQEATRVRQSHSVSDKVALHASCLIICESAGGSRDRNESLQVSNTVFYSASPLTDWSDLQVVPRGELIGVPGAAALPKAGGAVTQTLRYEQEHMHRSLETFGVFGGRAAASLDASRAEGYTIETLQPSR